MSVTAPVELGLGLLSIGRRWGAVDKPPPDENAALSLLKFAFENGIRFFDTAPAYASSERILGKALDTGIIDRGEARVATKMGEHWHAGDGAAYPGHSFDELARSLDRSMELLGRVDVLQLHKAAVENIASPDVLKAFDRAKSFGIRQFGASVSDMPTAIAACMAGIYRFLQFPYNAGNRSMENVFRLLEDTGMKAIVNRPFGMGALANGEAPRSGDELFRYVLDTGFSGVILTGTSSIDHLQSNIDAFRKAST